jgi:hypothetical protein
MGNRISRPRRQAERADDYFCRTYDPKLFRSLQRGLFAGNAITRPVKMTMSTCGFVAAKFGSGGQHPLKALPQQKTSWFSRDNRDTSHGFLFALLQIQRHSRENFTRLSGALFESRLCPRLNSTP